MDEATAAASEEFVVIAETEAGPPRRVLKEGDSFGVFDHYGNISVAESGKEGLYHDGTRFLSWFELLLFQRRPLLLSSTISRDNAVLVADLTNPDLRQGDRFVIAKGQIHVVRTRVLFH